MSEREHKDPDHARFDEREIEAIAERVRTLRALSDEASPGPWRSDLTVTPKGERISIYRRGPSHANDAPSLAQARSDAVLMATARDAIPWLCDTVRDLLDALRTSRSAQGDSRDATSPPYPSTENGARSNGSGSHRNVDADPEILAHALEEIRSVLKNELIPLMRAHDIGVEPDRARRIRRAFTQVDEALAEPKLELP